MTTYKLISKFSAILVSFHLDIIAADNDTAILSNILLNSSCLIVIK